MYMSPFMRSLLEAPQDNPDNPEEDDAQQNPEDQNAEPDAQDTTEEPTDPNAEENPDDVTDDGDPFNDDLGGEENQEDLSNPPDGLESPDATDDGSSDMETDAGEADEQNIQLNILPLSKLDRLTLKQKCYSNFKDLRVKINRVMSLVDDNEQLLDPKFRDKIINDLSELSNTVNGYMTIKFSFNNYEENAKNYNIFASQLDEIIKTVRKTAENKND